MLRIIRILLRNVRIQGRMMRFPFHITAGLVHALRQPSADLLSAFASCEAILVLMLVNVIEIHV